jgi:hypothetical protein
MEELLRHGSHIFMVHSLERDVHRGKLVVLVYDGLHPWAERDGHYGEAGPDASRAAVGIVADAAVGAEGGCRVPQEQQQEEDGE